MGGAETTLWKLLSNIDGRRFESRVVSLTSDGRLGQRLRDLDVPVWSLQMRRGVPEPGALLGLSRWLAQNRCQVIQTWMYHADLLGGVANRLSTNTPLIWNIRHGNPHTHPKLSTRWTMGACARLSDSLPTKIVCCSEASRQAHCNRGYPEGKMVVIPNGFDLDLFRPNNEARGRVRAELGIAEDRLLVGRVGRFHPQKDYKSMIKAGAAVLSRVPDADFLFCGDGITWDNGALTRWIDEAGIRARCHLAGPRSDVHRIHAALDLAVSSSYAEGFPNVVAEAMACGVPCVATDAGDSAYLIGNTGFVVPRKDPAALAQACINLLHMSSEARNRLGADARRRVADRFGLQRVVSSYEGLYEDTGRYRKTEAEASLACRA